MVTIASAQTGLSETIPVSLETTVKELSDWCIALLGLQGNVVIFKDGTPLDPEMKLGQAGVQNGDLLAAQVSHGRTAQPAPQAAAAASANASTGLDFSSILGAASAAASAATARASATAASSSGGLDFSNLLMSQQHQAVAATGPVYYPGMTLNDALDYNTNPEHIVTLLQTHDHLFKELNYHQPVLASKLKHQTFPNAVNIWREEILKGGIQSAVQRTMTQRKEHDYRQRLEKDPNDQEVNLIFWAFVQAWALLLRHLCCTFFISCSFFIFFTCYYLFRPRIILMHKSVKCKYENNISK